jgi:hypothetical protein
MNASDEMYEYTTTGFLANDSPLIVLPCAIDRRHGCRAAIDIAHQADCFFNPLGMVYDRRAVTVLVRNIDREALRRSRFIGAQC